MIAALYPAAELSVYDPDPARVASMPVPVTGHPSVQEAVAGAEVVVTLAPIVQPPAPTLQRAWLGDRFLALPADFNASFLPDVSADADLFLADDIGQYRYYQEQGQFGGWGVPERTAGQEIDTPNTARRVVCCNLGVGALDAAFADAALQAAAGTDLGIRLPV